MPPKIVKVTPSPSAAARALRKALMDLKYRDWCFCDVIHSEDRHHQQLCKDISALLKNTEDYSAPS